MIDSAETDLLSRQELIELTEKTRRSAQRRVLEKLGIKVTVRPNGTLIVLRAHRDAALGLRHAQRAVEPAATPNWAALD
jgi:hypothetical protein